MRSKNILSLAILVVVALLLSPACEDTNVTAPENSTITLNASGPVEIDQEAGETRGQTKLVAQILDEGGQPVDEVPLLFSTEEGGRLASAYNICVESTSLCSKTGSICVDTDDCADLGVDPAVLVTDVNGLAEDTLELHLIDDPASVTITATGANLEATETVTKIVTFGAADPDPIIAAFPSGGQRVGETFTFDGSDSVVDATVEKECYDWTIIADKRIFNPGSPGCVPCPDPVNFPAACSDECTTRGPSQFDAVVTLTIGEIGDEELDQTLQVFLRVSDDPTVVPFCNDFVDDDDVPSEKFGPNIAVLDYELDCDLTDPVVNAGNDKTVSLTLNDNGSGGVDVNLVANAFDDEDSVLDYTWDCDQAGTCSPTSCDQPAVTCTYEDEGTYTATVTVVNDCGRLVQDSLQITVNP